MKNDFKKNLIRGGVDHSFTGSFRGFVSGFLGIRRSLEFLVFGRRRLMREITTSRVSPLLVMTMKNTLAMTFSTLAFVLVLSLGVAGEARAGSEGCNGAQYRGSGWECESCADGYESYNNYGYMSCRAKCLEKYTRNSSGICVKTTCDSGETKYKGVCTRSCSNGGGYACLKNNGTEAANCCYKIEGDTTTVYPENQIEDYKIEYEIDLPSNKNLVIEGEADRVNGEFLSKFENVTLQEDVKWADCGCCWHSPRNLKHMTISDKMSFKTSSSYNLPLRCITGNDTNIVCLGDIDKCKTNVGSSYADKVVPPTKEQCDGAGSYYFTGSECAKRPTNGTDITCDHEYSGYVKVGNYCASPEDTYAKKRYTPAEAAQWLNEDNNTVTLTFKK